MSDLATLFERDPLSYTKEDIDSIIAEFRRKREQYMLDPKAKESKPKAKAAPVNVSLKDLLG